MELNRATSLNIFCIEDSYADQHLISLFIKQHSQPTSIAFADEGQQALDYLQGLSQNSISLLPDFIICDLNLPVLNGKEVISGIRKLSTFDATPIFALSSSNSPKEIREVEGFPYTYFFRKPDTLNDFEKVLCQLLDAWDLHQRCRARKQAPVIPPQSIADDLLRSPDG